MANESEQISGLETTDRDGEAELMERVFEAHGDRLVKLMVVDSWKQIKSTLYCTIHGVCSRNLHWIIRNRRHSAAEHYATLVGVPIHSLKAVHFLLPHPIPQIA